MLCGKANVRPNPPAPFPTREGGEIKASLLQGERSSKSREKSEENVRKVLIINIKLAYSNLNMKTFIQ